MMSVVIVFAQEELSNCETGRNMGRSTGAVTFGGKDCLVLGTSVSSCSHACHKSFE